MNIEVLSVNNTQPKIYSSLVQPALASPPEILQRKGEQTSLITLNNTVKNYLVAQEHFHESKNLEMLSMSQLIMV